MTGNFGHCKLCCYLPFPVYLGNLFDKDAGGFLRFQAQYLRRIRIPRWVDVPMSLRLALADAAIKRDVQACNRATFELYGLSCEEKSALGENGE